MMRLAEAFVAIRKSNDLPARRQAAEVLMPALFKITHFNLGLDMGNEEDREANVQTVLYRLMRRVPTVLVELDGFADLHCAGTTEEVLRQEVTGAVARGATQGEIQSRLEHVFAASNVPIAIMDEWVDQAFDSARPRVVGYLKRSVYNTRVSQLRAAGYIERVEHDPITGAEIRHFIPRRLSTDKWPEDWDLADNQTLDPEKVLEEKERHQPIQNARRRLYEQIVPAWASKMSAAAAERFAANINELRQISSGTTTVRDLCLREMELADSELHPSALARASEARYTRYKRARRDVLKQCAIERKAALANSDQALLQELEICEKLVDIDLHIYTPRAKG
ncbi:MAG: hypothetical protein HN348_19045 [Proteobacteria bacterium]|nr:hypothetical protein [Pseudomonadota bacterium]